MKNKRICSVFLCVVAIVCVAGFSAAEDIAIVIRKQIRQMAELGTNPQAAEADKARMDEIYKSVLAQGLNAVPVLEEILASKENVAEKKIALYLVAQIYTPRSAEEVERKGGLMIKYLKMGLGDESEDVRGYALQIVSGLWHSETYGILRDVFLTDKNTQLRIFALSKIAGYLTDAAYDVISQAQNDPDPDVQKAAVSYKAYQDEMKARQNAMAAETAPVKTESAGKGYGKNAN